MNVGKHLLAATLLVVAGHVLLTELWPTAAPPEKPTAPRSMEEALAIIERRGFCWSADRSDGLIGNRFLVAETPFSWQEVNVWPVRRRIEGAVAVYRFSHGLLVPADNTCVWGSFVLWGDPRLIERLTGHTDAMTAQ